MMIALPALTYSRVTAGLVAGAIASLFLADLAVTTLTPWAELKRLAAGILAPDLSAIEAWSVVWTVAFAVLGVGLGATVGFGLAIAYPRFAAVRRYHNERLAISG